MRRTRTVLRLAGAALWLLPATAAAEAVEPGAEWSSRGELAFESRVFPEPELSYTDPRSGTLRPLDPTTEDYGVGMAGTAELGVKSTHWRGKARAFGRADVVDTERSVLILEEGWAELRGDWGRLRVGADVVNWSATEAFHPADVINARNVDSNFERPEKLGEPMVALSINVGNGSLTGYGMPFYTESILPTPHSRLSFAPGLPERPGRLQLNSAGNLTSGDFGGQGALLASQTFGSADIAVHVIHHLDRTQPVYVPPALALLGSVPYGAVLYQTVTQSGLTYQQALGGLLTKLEFAYRYFHRPTDYHARLVGALDERDHAQLALGFEYTVNHPAGLDSTFLLEGQSYLGPQDYQQRRALGLFQNDVLLGYRLAFNDIHNRSLMLLAIGDVENPGELVASLSYAQRLSDVWGISGSARLLHAPSPDPTRMPTGLEALRRADQLNLSLTRYF